MPNTLDTAVRIESTRSRPPVGANQPDARSVYDASGLRVAEKVNDVWRFLIYDIGGKLVAEYGGVQATDEGGVKYVLQDWQGSTRAVIGNTGNVQSRSDYTAFGEPIGADTGLRTAAQGYGKSGSLRQAYALTEKDDATGLDHTWFRKNENRAGRWTSPDPYNGSMNLGNPQSFNRYSYVENQPTNFIDPSGLQLRYYDVYRGLACVVDENGVNRCIQYIDRYWYDDGTSPWDTPDPTGGWEGPGGGGGGEFPYGNLQVVLDACIIQLFGVKLSSFRPSEKGKNGSVTVNFIDPTKKGVTGLNGFGVVNDVTSYTRRAARAEVNAANAAGGRPPLPANSVLYGFTNPSSPHINFTVSDETNSLTILKTQIHELGHSLQYLARNAVGGWAQYEEAGWELENCVNNNGGFIKTK